jgi:hypothetical protein
MPAELDSCVQQVMSQGHDESSAFAICNAQLYGGSNFVTYNLDDKGDLFLKYFLADSTFAKNTAVGDFSLNGAAIGAKDKEAIGLPFTILPSRDLSLFGDWHPWSPNDGATYDHHVNFARKYSPGHIVAVTANSQLGAAQDVIKNGGRFAIVQITDQRTKDAYLANPHLIPKAVSPGIMNMEAPNKTNIANFRWAHLAAVPMGAYGSKATLYGSCLGGNTPCINKLIAASIRHRDLGVTINKVKHGGMGYCTIGASESLVNNNTSLINSNPNSSVNMSANPTLDNTSSNTQTAQTATGPTEVKPSVAPVKQPIATTPKPTGVLRLKTQKLQADPNNPTQVEQPKPVDTSKIDEVDRRVAELEAREQMVVRANELRNLIDMRLFVTGGKYNQKEHEAAIEEAARSNWTDEQISKYYGGLLKIKEFEESQNPKNKSNNNAIYGGSSAYQTNSAVPEIIGAAATAADMDLQTFKAQKVKALAQMFHLGDRL